MGIINCITPLAFIPSRILWHIGIVIISCCIKELFNNQFIIPPSLRNVFTTWSIAGGHHKDKNREVSYQTSRDQQ